MKRGFCDDIDKLTVDNEDFRRVLYTGEHLQLVLMTLKPGDLILTGTPEGVGPLKPGDTIEVEVTGIGVLSNPVEAA